MDTEDRQRSLPERRRYEVCVTYHVTIDRQTIEAYGAEFGAGDSAEEDAVLEVWSRDNGVPTTEEVVDSEAVRG